MRVTQCWGMYRTTLFSLGKNLLASTTIKVESVSAHRSSIFPGIKNVMAQCENGSQNQRSYGRYQRFPYPMTRRLGIGQQTAKMGPPTSERSDQGLLMLLVPHGCAFQRTLLDDHGVRLSLLERQRVPRRTIHCYSSSDESFEREKGDMIVYSGRNLDTQPQCEKPRNSRTNQIQLYIVSSIPIQIQ